MRPYHALSATPEESKKKLAVMNLDNPLNKKKVIETVCSTPTGEDILESFDVYSTCIENNRDEFNFMELGAGFGRWSVIARNIVRKIKPNLKFYAVAIEAEPKHFRMMKTFLDDNDTEDTIKAIHGAVTQGNEKYLEFASANYAQREKLDSINWWGQAICAPGKGMYKVKAYNLSKLLEEKEIWDLLDLDVQGSEADILIPNKKILDKKVKKLHIGTHGRDLETQLKAAFSDWIIINDYKCGNYKKTILQDTPFGKISFGDGILTLKNPNF
tara:strand:- start:7726 stop:8538 length:813 start_codon:yes stop_codon:yes gene_type:complete